MNEKKIPILRLAGRQAGRQGALTERSSSRLFSEGAVESPLVRASFSAPFSPSFQPTSLLLLPPTRTPGLPGAPVRFPSNTGEDHFVQEPLATSHGRH